MTQNVISLALSADQLAEVNKALDMLEKNLTELISLSVDDRSELRKMGPKSEMFARKAYDVLAQSPEILPGTFELADFTVDFEALDQLRPVFARIAALAHGAARALHEEHGFADGWGVVTEQLAAIVEAEAAGVND